MNGLKSAVVFHHGKFLGHALPSHVTSMRFSLLECKLLHNLRCFASKTGREKPQFYTTDSSSSSRSPGSNTEGENSPESGSSSGQYKTEEYIPRRFRKRLTQSQGSRVRSSVKTATGDQPENAKSDIQVPDFRSDENLTRKLRDQTRTAFRPKSLDPRETCVVLFPGQGSQFVGMGQKILQYPSVKELYEKASEILRYDLLKLCLTGPKSKLDRTEYCQPAVFVTSLAALEVLKEIQPMQFGKCVATAGFSVGEFAAAVFAKVLTFEDALHLLIVRARAMQEASEVVPSGMMTVRISHQSQLSLAKEAAWEYCRQKLDLEDPVIQIASYLSPEHRVIAGHQEALDFISHNAKDFNLQGLKPLPVSGAFHTRLMTSARWALSKELQKIPLRTPIIPLHFNVDGKAAKKKSIIVKNFEKQLTSPVRWEQTMHTIFSRSGEQHFPYTFEVGPGKQLGFLLRLVNLKAYKNYKKVEV